MPVRRQLVAVLLKEARQCSSSWAWLCRHLMTSDHKGIPWLDIKPLCSDLASWVFEGLRRPLQASAPGAQFVVFGNCVLVW
jgi:hypothetical protein